VKPRHYDLTFGVVELGHGIVYANKLWRMAQRDPDHVEPIGFRNLLGLVTRGSESANTSRHREPRTDNPTDT